MQDLEPRVRHCYSENFDLSVDKLVMVILVDCCFIFELFLKLFFNNQWTDDDDAILSKPWLRASIIFDLMLLENQLPFFVLEQLYNLAFATRLNDGHNHPTFIKLTFRAFDYFNSQMLASSAVSIKHFTDLIRTFLLQPSDRRPKRKAAKFMHLNSVTELKESGVKLKVNEKSQCLLDLQLSRHCDLEIPKLTVDDFTETWIRNMVALEQCHYPYEPYITDYVVFLGYLINTGKDVDVLVQNGIIKRNLLGDSNELARLFNGLSRNIVQVRFNSHYIGIFRELNAYCQHPWHSRKATWRRDYCKTPWKTVASAAAVVLLILTVIQTVFSILQVVL